MSDSFVIPAETGRKQAEAADPANSVWVAANAGSGKTHVLSRRVIRLLLDGVDPSRILCLTYTRAAAANMVNKVFDELGRWAVMGGDDLSAAIEALEARRPDAARLALARQLFARALETPGGLKIQTIHAFCEAVLHQFPLEANIAGHFELLDSQMEQALVAEARRDLLTGAADDERSELSRAFATVLATAGEKGLDNLLGEIVARRDGLRAFLDQLSGTGERLELMKREFGFDAAETEETIAATVWPDDYFTPQLAAAVHARGEAAGKTIAAEFGAGLKAACALTETTARLKALSRLFFRLDKGNWVVRSSKQIMSKGVGEHFDAFAEEFERYAEVLRAANDRVTMLRLVEATDAALTVADRLIARYSRLKSARGFLDFNDLITRTAYLLARGDAGAWVQYKLDRGLDHILVDEAQDTSPGQWEVIRRLAEEFFSGETARSNVNRTIFAVGDEKQSIYSFQGAEPAAFAESGFAFAKKVKAAGATFKPARLTYSFRSVGDVLSAVDLVFAQAEAREGLTVDPEEIEHAAVRAHDPGYVELWPMIGAEKVDEPEDWTEAIDHASQPAVRLAEAIAGRVRTWIDSGEIIEGKGRRLRAGDVMVLVRKRGSFVHALSRALKNRQVPVAGADRLRLRDHIAVKDLIALGRFALQADDDLSLAALLKSPVFNLGDDDLFALAHGRPPGVSLWQSLRQAATDDRRLAAVTERLATWRDEAGFRPVVEFYNTVLGRDGVRAAMIARLGHEAGEILDEFIGYAFACERTGIVGLGAFVETLDGAGPEIKREIAQSRDEVRIMTVHAAKGLEAPVVFLVDGGSAPSVSQHLPRLMPFFSRRRLWPGTGFLWRPGADLKTDFVGELEAEQKRKAEEEYRRLLYVGMTRAEDRLIVCGHYNLREPADGTWHKLVSTALAPAGEVVEAGLPGIDGDVLRYRSTDAPPKPAKDEAGEAEPMAAAFPEALRRPLPPEAPLPRPFSPSGAAALVEPAPELADASRSPVLDDARAPGLAIERGIAIHRMLQVMPDISDAGREAAGRRFLDRFGVGWDAGEREAALRSVLNVLADPAFMAVFAPGSRAEVAIAGHLRVAGVSRAVSGKIDRLAIGDDEVLIVDYKTNRAPPTDLDGIPAAYVAQIAVYSALLRQLHPGRRVIAGLLFTETPRLIRIPDTVITQALERLAVS
ncbi:MAG: double-strand break repair helicase AddA [Rhizobiaceae bacterium]